jgi:hypothetical protein
MRYLVVELKSGKGIVADGQSSPMMVLQRIAVYTMKQKLDVVDRSVLTLIAIRHGLIQA